ncbi:MAG: hypothetical protein ACRDJN_01250, partial [Chloroflexota bacterium]
MAGSRPMLHVANGADGTITRLDSQTGELIGRPLPAGPAPQSMAVGADGSLLVVRAGAHRDGALTHVAPADGGWVARPVSLAPGALVTQLAGDGGHYAAVAYHVPTTSAHGWVVYG